MNLDASILKHLIDNKVFAQDIADHYPPEMFKKEFRILAAQLIKYVLAYRSSPTKGPFLDRVKNESLKQHLAEEWNKIEKVQVDSNDYQYYLEQLKARYEKIKLASIQRIIDLSNEEDPVEKGRQVAMVLQQIKSVKEGRAYTQRTAKDHLPFFKEYIEGTKEDKQAHLIPTFYAVIDNATDGLSPQELVIIAGESASGKMLSLDTPIPTPDGFKNMRDIHPGDLVFGRDGKACKVLAESSVRKEKGWEFTFHDGSKIISHDDHQWLTFNKNERQQLHKCTDNFREKIRKQRGTKEAKPNRCLPPAQGSVKTTSEIIETFTFPAPSLKEGKGFNHAIPLTDPLELPHKQLPLDPYVLGLWLGDGTSSAGAITTADKECKEALVKAGFECTAENTKLNKDGSLNKASTYWFKDLANLLKEMNLLKNKHVPEDYLWAHRDQRLALLQGLMDSDGCANEDGSLEFCNKNYNISKAIVFLVRSLGWTCQVKESNAFLYKKGCGKRYRVSFSIPMPAFRLSRKLKKQKLCKNRKLPFRRIIKAERTPIVEMKCIEVDASDHLYLAGEGLVPTHNSFLLNNLATQMWLQGSTFKGSELNRGYNVLFFSLEMGYQQCFDRFVARLTGVPYRNFSGTLSYEEKEKIYEATKFIERYPYEFEIVDIPRNLTVREMELRYQESLLTHKPDIVVVDYMGLMGDAGNKEQDWLKLGLLAGELHEFARTYDVVLLTAAQLTDLKRGNKGEAPKSEDAAVGMHRIGRSSLIMHHANLGIQIEKRVGEEKYTDLKYHLIKNRKGPLGKGFLSKDFAKASLLDRGVEEENKNAQVSLNSSGLTAKIKALSEKAENNEA